MRFILSIVIAAVTAYLIAEYRQKQCACHSADANQVMM